MQMAIFKDPRPGVEADATIPVGVNQQGQPERMATVGLLARIAQHHCACGIQDWERGAYPSI